MSAAVPPRRLLLLAAGFALWAHALAALYGAHAIGCAFGWPRTIHRGILVALLAAHLAVLGWLALRYWRRHRISEIKPRPLAFIEFVGVGAAMAAWAATLFTLAPAFVLSLCR